MDYKNKQGTSTHKTIFILLLSAWVLIAGFAIYLAFGQQLNRAQEHLQRESARLELFLDAQLRSHRASLSGLAAYLSSTGTPVPTRDASYVEHVLAAYPAILGMGYLEGVDPQGMGWLVARRDTAGRPLLSLDDISLSGRLFQAAAGSQQMLASHSFLTRNGEHSYVLVQALDGVAGGVAERPQRFALMLVSVQALMQGAPLENRRGLQVSLHVGRQPHADGESLLFLLDGPPPPVEASALLPSFHSEALLGGAEQAFSLRIERQLLWQDLDREHLLGVGLTVLISFSLLLIYTLALYRSERARLALARCYEHQALHDPLTDLPNRLLIADRLNHAIANAKRNGTQVALLFLDLDRFKAVNDAYGHEIGDQLLQAFAERLKARVRRNDTVGRISGDEFIVIFEGVRHHGEVEALAEKLQASLCGSYILHQHVISIAYSVGLAHFPADGENSGDLLRAADRRMYTRKKHHPRQPLWIQDGVQCPSE